MTYPSPVSAQQACMCQPWSLMDVKLSCCEISAADIEPLMSCLLANTNTAAFRSSYRVKDQLFNTVKLVAKDHLLPGKSGPIRQVGYE